MTYHVSRLDCFGSSRIMLQSTWDSTPSFVHPAVRVRSKGTTQNSPSVFSLSWAGLCRLVRRSSRLDAVVFHAQSSLPFLLMCRILLSVLSHANSPRLVYDMHDLHERPCCHSLWTRFRYGFLRYHLLRSIEMFVFRDVLVRKMTVSQGLGRLVAKRYNCPLPEVVYSAPDPPPRDATRARDQVLDRAILYFGTIERAPFEVVPILSRSDLSLHLYGRSIDHSSVIKRLGGVCPDCVFLHGSYTPADLSFISEYKALLLFQPSANSLNLRYSLPNKLFQTIAHGASLIVSPNFLEIRDLLSRLSGSYVTVASASGVPAGYESLLRSRTPDYRLRARRFAQRLHAESRQRYRAVVGLG